MIDNSPMEPDSPDPGPTTSLLGMGDLRPYARQALPSLVAVFVGLSVGAIIIALSGENPLRAYGHLFAGSFGGVDSIAETLAKAAPVLMIALGVAVAFRARVFNIGAQGQFLFGALAGAVVGAWVEVPGWLFVPFLLVIAGVAGALWALIPALLKAYLGANEVITTLMLNFVAIFIINYLLSGPLLDPLSFGQPQTALIAESARLPLLMSATRLHIGLLIALALAVVSYKFMFGSIWGLHIRSFGENPVASERIGISPARQIIVVMLISGFAAGMAGYFEVGGRHYRMIAGTAGVLGFTAVVVALLGRLHPIGIVIAVILFAGLEVGAQNMNQFSQVPASIVLVIEAVIILFVLLGDAARRPGETSRSG